MSHPEIERYRLYAAQFDSGPRNFLDLERAEYIDKVHEALTVLIPRLYAVDFDDQEDVPEELYALIERLESELDIDLEWQPWEE